MSCSHHNPVGIFEEVEFVVTDYLGYEVTLILYLGQGWDIQGLDKEIIQQLFELSELDWEIHMVHQIRGVQHETNWIENFKLYHTDEGVWIHREEVQNPVLKESPQKWQESVIQQFYYKSNYYGGFIAKLPTYIKTRPPP